MVVTNDQLLCHSRGFTDRFLEVCVKQPLQILEKPSEIPYDGLRISDQGIIELSADPVDS